MTFPYNPPVYTPPLPFPQRFQKTKLDEQFAQFLNMFQKLEISIPFADALAQMPNYVKFMEEIISNKKKLETYGTVNLTENCSAIIQRKLQRNSRIRVVLLSLTSLGSTHSARLNVILGQA